MSKPHVFPLRVYYEDTDAVGIVYYANYLKFAERARTEMLREVGIESSRVMDDYDVALTVRKCSLDYRKPARLDDALEVHSRILEIGGASMQGEQQIKLDGNVLVVLQIKLACMATNGKPARMPKELRATLNELVDISG